MRLLIERLAALTEKTEDLINDPAHMPKALAKAFVQAIKPLGKVTVVKAEATMPQDWDYGFNGIFEVEMKGGNTRKLGVVLRFGEGAVRGVVSKDATGGALWTTIEMVSGTAKVADAIRSLANSAILDLKPRASDE